MTAKELAEEKTRLKLRLEVMAMANSWGETFEQRVEAGACIIETQRALNEINTKIRAFCEAPTQPQQDERWEKIHRALSKRLSSGVAWKEINRLADDILNALDSK